MALAEELPFAGSWKITFHSVSLFVGACICCAQLNFHFRSFTERAWPSSPQMLEGKAGPGLVTHQLLPGLDP